MPPSCAILQICCPATWSASLRRTEEPGGCTGCLLSPLEVSVELDSGWLDCLLQPVAAPLETAANGSVMATWMAKLYRQEAQALVCKGSQEVAAMWDPCIALQANL